MTIKHTTVTERDVTIYENVNHNTVGELGYIAYHVGEVVKFLYREDIEEDVVLSAVKRQLRHIKHESQVDKAQNDMPCVNLQDLMAGVARSHIKAALASCDNNKTKAAHLLGLPSYQTLSNWMEKYDVKTGS